MGVLEMESPRRQTAPPSSQGPVMSRHSLRVTTAWQVAIVKLKSIAETYLISARLRRFVALPERSRSNRKSMPKRPPGRSCDATTRVRPFCNVTRVAAQLLGKDRLVSPSQRSPEWGIAWGTQGG